MSTIFDINKWTIRKLLTENKKGKKVQPPTTMTSTKNRQQAMSVTHTKKIQNKLEFHIKILTFSREKNSRKNCQQNCIWIYETNVIFQSHGWTYMVFVVLVSFTNGGSSAGSGTVVWIKGTSILGTQCQHRRHTRLPSDFELNIEIGTRMEILYQSNCNGSSVGWLSVFLDLFVSSLSLLHILTNVPSIGSVMLNLNVTELSISKIDILGFWALFVA